MIELLHSHRVTTEHPLKYIHQMFYLWDWDISPMICDYMDVLLLIGIIVNENLWVLPQFEIFHDIIDKRSIALHSTEIEYEVASMATYEVGCRSSLGICLIKIWIWHGYIAMTKNSMYIFQIEILPYFETI